VLKQCCLLLTAKTIKRPCIVHKVHHIHNTTNAPLLEITTQSSYGDNRSKFFIISDCLLLGKTPRQPFMARSSTVVRLPLMIHQRPVPGILEQLLRKSSQSKLDKYQVDVRNVNTYIFAQLLGCCTLTARLPLCYCRSDICLDFPT